MNRNSSSAALTLRLRSRGESNREATFLSAEEGIITATLYGGPKSKLRSHVAPFHSGILWVYRDPSKDFRKVSDFDVKAWRPGIRELYERSAAAFAVADTILAFGGGGLWPQALALSDTALDAIESADAEGCSRQLLVFLWKWAGLLGLAPDPRFCSSCEESLNAVLWFIEGEGFLCPACAESCARSGLAVGPGAAKWLAKITESGADIRRIGLDAPSYSEAKNLVFSILSLALGRSLESWNC